MYIQVVQDNLIAIERIRKGNIHKLNLVNHVYCQHLTAVGYFRLVDEAIDQLRAKYSRLNR